MKMIITISFQECETIPDYANSGEINIPAFWATSDTFGIFSNFSGVKFMINLIFFSTR